jgi:hypothetical protein
MLRKACRCASRNLGEKGFADTRKVVKRRQGVADHRLEIERMGRLVEGPKGFCKIGVELEEFSERLLGHLVGPDIQLVASLAERRLVLPPGCSLCLSRRVALLSGLIQECL